MGKAGGRGRAKGSRVGVKQWGCRGRSCLASFCEIWSFLHQGLWHTEDVEPRQGGHARPLLYLSSGCAVTAGTTVLTSETRCMVSGPIQVSSASRTDRPIWLNRSTGASFFCWPGCTKSRGDWDHAEWRASRATRAIGMTLHRGLPPGELLPEAAMAGSAGREAQGERRARSDMETHRAR